MAEDANMVGVVTALAAAVMVVVHHLATVAVAVSGDKLGSSSMDSLVATLAALVVILAILVATMATLVVEQLDSSLVSGKVVPGGVALAEVALLQGKSSVLGVVSRVT